MIAAFFMLVLNETGRIPFRAPNDRSRLDPSWTYGLPLSIAATETAKLVRAKIMPTPKKSAS
jgi:hypothetical protein